MVQEGVAPQGSRQPLHKEAQRLRWFVGAFAEQLARTSAETGNEYSVDEALLAATFTDWLKSFNAQKPESSDDNPAFVGFAAGLMLRTLVRKKPARLVSKPAGADVTNPAYFWPEGYLYVAFCLNVRGLVLEMDFHGHQHPGNSLRIRGPGGASRKMSRRIRRWQLRSSTSSRATIRTGRCPNSFAGGTLAGSH